MSPDDPLALERLEGFEKLGWVKKQKQGRKERGIAEKMGLCEAATTYKWFLPSKTSGEVKTNTSSSGYENKQEMKDMEHEQEICIETNGHAMPAGYDDFV